MKKRLFYVAVTLLTIGLSACGGGGGGEAADSNNWDTLVWDQGAWQ